MAKASATIEVAATVDEVWTLVGGFDSLPDWLPLIVESKMAEGGRVRHLKTADGQVVVERLQTFDNAARTYTYSIVEGPFPVTDYLAKLQVSEVPGTQATKIVWSGTFTGAGITEDEAATLFDGVYSGGLDALKANFPS